jgi:hypothetical protein
MHTYETRKNIGLSLKGLIRVKNKFAIVKLEIEIFFKKSWCGC